MNKKLLLFLLAVVLATPAFASVGIRVNSQPYGTSTDLNFNCGAGVNSQPTADGSVYNVTCSPNLATAGIANGGSTSIASTVTVVPIGFAFVRMALDSDGNSAFTAKTLANGYPGQILAIFASGITPSGATTGANATITPATSTGFTSVELSAIKDEVILEYFNDTVGWILLNWINAASNSITITLKN